MRVPRSGDAKYPRIYCMRVPRSGDAKYPRIYCMRVPRSGDAKYPVTPEAVSCTALYNMALSDLNVCALWCTHQPCHSVLYVCGCGLCN